MAFWWTAMAAGAAVVVSSIPGAAPIQGADKAPSVIAPPIADQAVIASEIFDLSADSNDRLTVPVLINGQGPFDFVIDTGAQATIVSRELGERLKLMPAGHATLVGIASQRRVDLVALNRLELGQQIMGPLNAPMLERAHVGADGMIGLDSLQDFRVLIDFRDNSMTIAASPETGAGRGFEIIVRANRNQGRMIITNASIDGIRTAVIVDTGAQGSIGNIALQRKLHARDRDRVTSSDVHGSLIEGELDYAGELRMGRLKLQGVPIGFADAQVFQVLGLDERPTLILGMQELRRMDRVAIDFTSGKVLFDLPAGFSTTELLQRKFSATRIESRQPN